MLIRGDSTSRQGKRHKHTIAVVGLCLLYGVASAEDPQEEHIETATPESDATDNSMPEIRIKRLRLADPESKETMLVHVAGHHPAYRRS